MKKKITQVQLAKYSDVSLGSIKRFERTGEISLSTLIKIAFALDCEDEYKSIINDYNKQKNLEGLECE